MEKQELNNTQKKEWAKELFIRGDLNQKQIAEKVGVNENTIGRWVEEGKWDTMRKSLMTTKTEILHDLYDTLAAMRDEARTAATDGDPDTKPDTDGIYKLTLAIRKLESHAGIGEIILMAQEFISFIKNEDLPLSQQVTKWFDMFIESKLKAANAN